MKTRLIILFFLTTGLLTGCYKNHSEQGLPEYNTTGPYFPMHVGDYWEYQQEEVNLSVKVVDTAEIGGTVYFVFREIINGQTEMPAFKYFRAESDWQIFTHINGQDQLYIDFSRIDGQPIAAYGGHDVQILDSGFPLTVPAGVFHDCIEIYFDNPAMADEERVNTFAPGVGLIEISNYAYQFGLVSALVNGRTYSSFSDK